MHTTIKLTARETDVCDWVLTGAPPRTIARRLNVTENRVEFHLRNIFHKFHIDTHTELAIFYLQHYPQAKSKPKPAYQDEPFVNGEQGTWSSIGTPSRPTCWLDPDRRCYPSDNSLQSQCYECDGHRVCGRS